VVSPGFRVCDYSTKSFARQQFEWIDPHSLLFLSRKASVVVVLVNAV
jgi:hypothetical protein